MKSYFFSHFILLVLVLTVVAIFLFGLFVFDIVDGQNNKALINVPPLKIEIDSRTRTGEVPFLFRIGVWLQDKANYDYIISKFFAENQVGKIQMEIGNELALSNDFEDYKKALERKYGEDSVYRRAIEEIKKSGQTLIIGHWPGKMPTWLTSRIDEREYSKGRLILRNSPPKCYEQKCDKKSQIICYDQKCDEKTAEQFKQEGSIIGWAGIIDYTVRFFKKELGVSNLGYFVGHEQNKDWIGQEEEFFKIYEYTYKTVKKIDDKIIVGGGGPWHPLAKRVACDSNHYNATGLQLCETTKKWAADGEDCKNPQIAESESCEPTNFNLLQYARPKGLGVDFVNYHHFRALPQTYNEIASKIRLWLQGAGFSKDTPLYPADWTFWGGDYPADYLDTEQHAAYVISALYQMKKAGIQWHSYDFNVTGGNRDEEVIKERGKSVQFIGDWPIFTRNQIIKPVYNAFRMLSIFNGVHERKTPQMLQVSVPQDDYITVLASQTLDQKTNRILVANFIPSDTMARNLILSNLKECFLDKNHSKEEFQTMRDTLQDIIKTKKNLPIEAMNATDFSIYDKKVKTDMIDCLKQTSQKIQELKDFIKNPRLISFILKNLSSGKYSIKKYLIDKDHSNSCRYNQQTAPDKSTPCGIGGEIDKKVESATKEAQLQGKNTAFTYLKQRGYSDSDFDNIKGMARSCKLKISCLDKAIDEGYKNLDRCRSKKDRTGRPISQKCSSSDIVKTELKEAGNIYKKIRHQTFYHTSPNSIDQINNQKELTLEIVEQKSMISRSINFRSYEETIKLNPNAVMLIEITKN